MKKLFVVPFCLTLAATPVFAGDSGKAVMEPEVIATEASSSGGVDYALIFMLQLMIVGALHAN